MRKTMGDKRIGAVLLALPLIVLMLLPGCARKTELPLHSFESPDNRYQLRIYENRIELGKGAALVGELESDGATMIDAAPPVYWLYDMVMLPAEEGTYILHYSGNCILHKNTCTESTKARFDANGRGSFELSVDAFAEKFNSCRLDYGCEGLLSAAAEWSAEIDFPSLIDGKPVVRRSYKNDVNNGLEPEISLYSDGESGEVELVAVGFENHGYTQWGSLLSKERSFFALKSLLGLEDDRLVWEIFGMLYPKIHAAENYAPRGSVPAIPSLCVYGHFGFFSYFSSGISWLCILPVSPGQLEALSSAGTQVKIL